MKLNGTNFCGFRGDLRNLISEKRRTLVIVEIFHAFADRKNKIFRKVRILRFEFFRDHRNINETMHKETYRKNDDRFQTSFICYFNYLEMYTDVVREVWPANPWPNQDKQNRLAHSRHPSCSKHDGKNRFQLVTMMD